MTPHDPKVTMRQMLTHAQEAQTLSQGKQRANLDHDRLLELALTRLLEIIGEAANWVPPDIQVQYPAIP